MNEFKNFGLSDNIIKALDKLGFTTPTEIQAKSIPVLTQDKKVDFHGQAQTGTGKTLAFGIPLVNNIDVENRSVQALIIAPTRELVLQIEESLSQVTQFYKKLKIASIYGGVDIMRQTSQLKRGIHIVVGTPGRLNDHMRRKNLSLKSLKTLVLDEADIMLDMGFKKEIDFILDNSQKNRQIWLFSATTKIGVDQIKKSHMSDVFSVRVAKKSLTATNTEQFYCVVSSKHRFQVLCRVVDQVKESFYGIIFCQTKLLCAEVARKLGKKGYSSAALHGDMDQKMRNKVIQRFKKKDCDILVATDVAARGIDVNSLSHVINFSLPEDQESYVHRVGRTGRAGKKGTAITFVEKRETRRIKSLANRFGFDIKEFDIPSLQDLINSRISKAISYFNESCIESNKLKDKLDPLRTSMQDLPKDQIVNVAINLLSDKFLKDYENAEEIPQGSFADEEYGNSGRHSRFSGGRSGRSGKSDRFGGRSGRSGKSGNMRDMGDVSEIVLHVGSDDGIEKSDILRYCVDSKAIDRRQIERVRVIKRRSFVVVPAKLARKVVTALSRKKFQSRRIRVGLSDRN